MTSWPVSSATSRTAVMSTCSPGSHLPLGSVQSSYLGRCTTATSIPALPPAPSRPGAPRLGGTADPDVPGRPRVAGTERVDPRVLQEPADDAADPDVLRHARHARPQG